MVERISSSKLSTGPYRSRCSVGRSDLGRSWRAHTVVGMSPATTTPTGDRLCAGPGDPSRPVLPDLRPGAGGEAVTELVTGWLGREGFRELGELFGVRPTAVDVTGRDALAVLSAWEAVGDFCWNVRAGVPPALVRALNGVGARGLELPEALDPAVWEDPRCHVASLYLGSLSGRWRYDRAGQSVRSAVAAYPGVTGQAYRERSDIEELPLFHDDPWHSRVAGAVADLGLVERRRVRSGRYDHVVVLGGGPTASLARTEGARELLCGEVDAGAIWLLGSPRPLTDRELALVADWAPWARDEFDLLSACAERVLGVGGFEQDTLCGCTNLAGDCASWRRDRGRAVAPPVFQHRRRRTYLSGRTPLHVLSASTGQPPERPNTADSYEVFAQVAGLDRTQSALLVTNQLFVPFQFFDAVRMLHVEHRVGVSAAGVDGGARPGHLAYQLQELQSALRSARRLMEAVRGVGRGRAHRTVTSGGRDD